MDRQPAEQVPPYSVGITYAGEVWLLDARSTPEESNSGKIEIWEA